MPLLSDVLYLLAWNGYEDQAYRGSMTCREAWEDDRILFPHIINKKFGKKEKTIIGSLVAHDFNKGSSIPRIERLIGLGADPDIPHGALSLTPFMETCCLGDRSQMELFKFFLTRANIHGQGGWTPIAYKSLYAGCPIKQQMLLDHGADIHRITDGESVLYTVCEFTKETDLSSIKFLLDHGANPNIVSKGRTPLQVCLDNGRADIARLLMKYGATIPEGNDCIWDAYYSHEEKVLKFLVANGKTIPPPLLMHAVRNVNVKGVRMLLACGACPNTIHNGRPILFHVNGLTPEKAEIIRLLCEAGADIHVKESVGVFDDNTSAYKLYYEPFLYEMVRQYIRTKNENTFTVIKLLIARGAQPPPLEMYNRMSEFKKNPVEYVHMNVLFMKARRKKSEAKTAKSLKA